jgi:hypothetical protein
LASACFADASLSTRFRKRFKLMMFPMPRLHHTILGRKDETI